MRLRRENKVDKKIKKRTEKKRNVKMIYMYIKEKNREKFRRER